MRIKHTVINQVIELCLLTCCLQSCSCYSEYKQPRNCPLLASMPKNRYVPRKRANYKHQLLPLILSTGKCSFRVKRQEHYYNSHLVHGSSTHCSYFCHSLVDCPFMDFFNMYVSSRKFVRFLEWIRSDTLSEESHEHVAITVSYYCIFNEYSRTVTMLHVSMDRNTKSDHAYMVNAM